MDVDCAAFRHFAHIVVYTTEESASCFESKNVLFMSDRIRKRGNRHDRIAIVDRVGMILFWLSIIQTCNVWNYVAKKGFSKHSARDFQWVSPSINSIKQERAPRQVFPSIFQSCSIGCLLLHWKLLFILHTYKRACLYWKYRVHKEQVWPLFEALF